MANRARGVSFLALPAVVWVETLATRTNRVSKVLNL